MGNEGVSKIGILLTTSPERQDYHTVIRLAEAALAAGKQVDIFLMCDGVLNLMKAEFLSLTERGATITVCYQNLLERDMEKSEDSVVYGSQYDLANIVHTCDRFLAFN